MSKQRLWWPLTLALLIILTLALSWAGYIASDDGLYFEGARHWVDKGPFAGDSHWTTRFPVILTFAGAILIFGKGFGAFWATSILFYMLIIALTGRFTAEIATRQAGWIAAMLVATLPVIASNSSIVNCDLPEVLFLLEGALLLLTARKDVNAVAAGLCWGCAILCRETALFSLAGLGLLLLLGKPIARRALLLAAFGAALVFTLEAVFQYIMTGDPLHRYGLAFHHDSHIDRAANPEGNFLVNPVVDPLLVLLINNDFGLLFWMLIAAVIGLMGKIRALKLTKPTAVLGSMAVANFILIAVAYKLLVLNPRYFSMAAVVATIFVAIWLSRLTPRRGNILLGALVTINLGLLSLQDSHPQWAAEAYMVALHEHTPTKVITDADTLRRATLYQQFSGQQNAVSGAPMPDAVYFSKNGHPLANATLIARYSKPDRSAVAILRAVGIVPLLPTAIRQRLADDSATPTLWYVKRSAR